MRLRLIVLISDRVVSPFDFCSITVVFITCGGIVARCGVIPWRVELFLIELSYWVNLSDEFDSSAALGNRRLNEKLLYFAPQLVVLSFQEFELPI